MTNARKPRAAQDRKTTRAAQIIALLERPGGVSLKEIMSATGWQAHSVRAFISGQLGKKLKLQVKSFERKGEHVYAIERRNSPTTPKRRTKGERKDEYTISGRERTVARTWAG